MDIPEWSPLDGKRKRLALLGATLGPSILQYPRVFKELGGGLFLLALLVTALLNAFSVHYVLDASQKTGSRSLHELSHKLWGRRGRFFLSVVTLSLVLYPMATYLSFAREFAYVLIGKWIPPLVVYFTIPALVYAIAVASPDSLFGMFPVILMGLSVDLGVVWVLGYDAVANHGIKQVDWRAFRFGGERCIASWAGSVLFGFICHPSAIEITSCPGPEVSVESSASNHGTASAPRSIGWRSLVVVNCFAAVLYLLSGIFGVSVTDSPQINFLNSPLKTCALPYRTITVLFELSTLLSFPANLLIMISSVQNILGGIVPKYKPLGRKLQILIAVSCISALTVPSKSPVVLSVIFTLAALVLIFVLPALIKINQKY